jgi:hypothetical protein
MIERHIEDALAWHERHLIEKGAIVALSVTSIGRAIYAYAKAIELLLCRFVQRSTAASRFEYKENHVR